MKKLILLLALFIVAFIACEKDTIEDFDPQIQEELSVLNNNMANNERSGINTRGQDDLIESFTSFIQENEIKFKKKYGVPVIEEAITIVDDAGELAFIPMKPEDGDQMQAMILAYYGEGKELLLKSFTKKEIIKLNKKDKKKDKLKELNIELGLGMWLVLESRLFGYSDCDLAELWNQVMSFNKRSIKTREMCFYELITITTEWIQINGDGTSRSLGFTTEVELRANCSGGSGITEIVYVPNIPTGGGGSIDPYGNGSGINDEPDTEKDDENRATISEGFGFTACGQESFPYNTVGTAGYTVNMREIMHGYLYGFLNVKTYKIPSLCIQVPNHDFGTSINEIEAAERTARAWDDARWEVLELLNQGILSTSAQAKLQWRVFFLDHLREEWNLVEGSGSISVSYNDCASSGVNTSYIHYNTPFGCIESRVK